MRAILLIWALLVGTALAGEARPLGLVGARAEGDDLVLTWRGDETIEVKVSKTKGLFQGPVTINRAGSMLTVFFTAGPVTDYTSAGRSDVGRYAAFFHACLDEGIMLAPSQYEAAFLSTAHTDDDLARTLTATQAAFRRL